MQTPKEVVRFFTPSNIPYAPDSQIAFQLKIDSITAPIRIPGQEAYLLIKKTAYIPPKLLSFADSRTEILKNMVREKLPAFRGKLLEELRQKSQLIMDKQAIEKHLTFK